MCNFWGRIILFLSSFLICFAKTECKTSKYKGNTEDPVAFYVYTRQNNEVAQSLKPDVESIVRNILNPTKSITLAIHDILGDKNADEYTIIKNSMLNVEDTNIIVVDYSSLVPNGKGLEMATFYIHSVAEAVNDLLKMLHFTFNVNSKNIHLIGFGLGAHIAGIVGQEFYQHSGEKIKRITALDPTGVPFSETTPTTDKLTPDDANFVEVVHTNGGELGFFSPCGHIDYYPNGGQTQPGCNATSHVCSHKRSYEFVPEMWSPIKNQEFLLLKCLNTEILNIHKCRWVNAKMGDLYQQSYGVFYVETNPDKPYGKGAFEWQFF